MTSEHNMDNDVTEVCVSVSDVAMLLVNVLEK